MKISRGIIPVLQTPFDETGAVQFDDLGRLVDDAIAGGVSGLLAPAVASEVAFLKVAEREDLVRFVARVNAGRVPLLIGASAETPEECLVHARVAEAVNADAVLVAVPETLYQDPAAAPDFFHAIACRTPLPLVIQDLQWNGPGLSLDLLALLREDIPTVAGFKIETVPAGPKYSAVRNRLGPECFIAGGWAIPQMIEGLDRGVDAFIPEASMVRAYVSILRLYDSGRRDEAVRRFRGLLPVLSFANQEIRLSIAFFKALLARRGIFSHEQVRWPGFSWDGHSRRIADELIQLYLDLERELR